MTKIRPINPDEIIREKAEAIPDQVIAGFNELIARNWNNGKLLSLQMMYLKLFKFLLGLVKIL